MTTDILSPELQALAKQWVDLPHFRPMDGMRLVCSLFPREDQAWRIARVRKSDVDGVEWMFDAIRESDGADEIWDWDKQWLPDVSDVPTYGCLLEQVCEAWDFPYLHLKPIQAGSYKGMWNLTINDVDFNVHKSKAVALLTALKEAK